MSSGSAPYRKLSIQVDDLECCFVMQADRMLESFKASALELDAAIGQLPIQDLGSAAEETQDAVEALRNQLQKAKFELSPQHAELLARYRDACDKLKGPFDQLQTSCKDILQQVSHMGQAQSNAKQAAAHAVYLAGLHSSAAHDCLRPADWA